MGPRRRAGPPLRTPHLSIARVRRNGDVGKVVDVVSALLPLRVRLETLELTIRSEDGWQTLASVPLG